MYEVPFYIIYPTIALVLVLLAITFLPDWVNYPLLIGIEVLWPFWKYRRLKKMKDKYLNE